MSYPLHPTCMKTEDSGYVTGLKFEIVLVLSLVPAVQSKVPYCLLIRPAYGYGGVECPRLLFVHGVLPRKSTVCHFN